ncbi:MAG: hypothetical protein COB54_07630 [Alphaproteobacteria bacterium]|nr:MAG: hypothetical protein COB54_07630 [Alphaproteobacteria bacterium]
MTPPTGDLNYSRPFDQFIWSDHHQVNMFTDRLYNDFLAYKQYQRKPGKVTELKPKGTLKVLCLNLFTAWQVSLDLFTALSCNTVDYSRSSRYRNTLITSSFLFPILDFLLDAGLLVLFRGYWDNVKKEGKVTRIRATTKLMQMMVNEYQITGDMIERHPNSETIILKDKDKKYKEYKDTKTTILMRQNLAAINQALANTSITLNAPPDIEREIHEILKQDTLANRKNNQGGLDFSRKHLKRIFNNASFEHGGRFYGGWWQSVPNRRLKGRQYVTIDNEETIEIDYGGMQIMLLYHSQGQDIPQTDPYDLAGYLEGVDRYSIKKAFFHLIFGQHDPRTIHHLSKPNDVTLPKGITYADLLNSLLDKHRIIEACFQAPDIATQLQYQDSVIAEEVMLALLDQDIIALPIHDSFIVQMKYRDQLKQAMTDVFNKYVGVEPILKEG